MFKKLILSCMAVAAFAAFVLPATASAATATDPEDVKVGASITGKNIGSTFFMRTDGTTPEVTCTTAHATGTVTQNSGGVFAGTISTFNFSGTGAVHADNGLNECTTSTFGNAYITVANLPLTITTVAPGDNINVTGKNGGKVKFIIGSTVAGECEYEATNAAITGTYTTAATTVLTVNNTQTGSGSKLIRGGFFCPTSGQLKMSFYLQTTNGVEIGIS